MEGSGIAATKFIDVKALLAEAPCPKKYSTWPKLAAVNPGVKVANMPFAAKSPSVPNESS